MRHYTVCCGTTGLVQSMAQWADINMDEAAKLGAFLSVASACGEDETGNRLYAITRFQACWKLTA